MATALKVLASTALKTSFDEFGPQFERENGVTLAASYGPSARVAKLAGEGEPNDVTITTPKLLDDLVRNGKIVAGTHTDVARSPMALAVRQGAPRPDISSGEKFREAMLAAKSLAMSNPVGGGQSGANLVRIFERLGIAEEMKTKSIYGPGGPAGLIGLFLVRGEADVGIQQLPELMAVPGIDIIGPLPSDIQSVTTFSAGISTSAANPDAARKLIAFLTSPLAKAVIKAKGMETG
jgi:molybdate transport system substrate-binding protein